MNRRPIRAVLFDLDGTLFATRKLYLECFADALEPVLGRRPTHEEMMARRPRAEVRFLREMSGEESHAEVMDRFHKRFKERHEADFQGVYTGVPQMLKALREVGVPLGIVTGKSRRSWGITSSRVVLGKFSVGIFDDDVPAPKPDPAGLIMALELMARPAEEVVYVGDSESDLEAAQRAGVRPGGVLWSKREHERESFRQAALEGGGLTFDSPKDVVDRVLGGE